MPFSLLLFVFFSRFVPELEDKTIQTPEVRRGEPGQRISLPSREVHRDTPSCSRAPLSGLPHGDTEIRDDRDVPGSGREGHRPDSLSWTQGGDPGSCCFLTDSGSGSGDGAGEV